MNFLQELENQVAEELGKLLKTKITTADFKLLTPPSGIVGDYALACFSLAKKLKNSPVLVAQNIAKDWPELPLFKQVKAVGPYLNFSLEPNAFVASALKNILAAKKYGQNNLGQGKKILIEFSGPNTNKPQHIGHVRNNVIGQCLVNIYRACGYKVIATNIINDRGIHVIKSMLAWQKYGQGETPQSGLKGDHLVGKYYVKFGQLLKEEEKEYLIKNKISLEKLNDLEKRKVNDDFLRQSPLMQSAQNMLRAWEKNDPEVRKLWKMMNDWVYAGYKVTYSDLGIRFDHVDYESDTYLLGKDLIELGLKKGVFYKKEDGSIWVDLSQDGLDQKLVRRADGTSVYITQDLGTAKKRYDKFKFDQAVYVVASEQDYHFKVLFLVLDKLGFAWAKNLYHLSYGMVSRPEGKIKSREGKTADADTIITETISKAKEVMTRAVKQISLDESSKETITRSVALGALKFSMLGTNPQKDIVFNPEESISFDGYTGTFIQYTHARINSILAKAKINKKIDWQKLTINAAEKKLAKDLLDYPDIIKQTALEYNPAILTHYLFELAKTFNNFYQLYPVLKAENADCKNLRLELCLATKNVLASGLASLGIEAPDKM